MTTSSNANGAAMIEYHVFVALHDAKASSIKICFHFPPLFYLHIMLVDTSLAAKPISVALSYNSIEGVSETVKRLPLTMKPEEQDGRVGHSEACALRSPADNVYLVTI